MVFGRAESIVLGTNLRWTSEGPSVELNFTYPLHKISFNTLEIYFQAQYFNGYAESLLNYTEHTSAVRFGLAIVR
jgi:outer membrane phospholipase A